MESETFIHELEIKEEILADDAETSVFEEVSVGVRTLLDQ